MTYRSTKATLRKLQSLAQGQGGYFTAKQAAVIGYTYPHLDYHLRARNFERAGHGIYRLPDIPLNEHDDLIRLAFWSRDRADRPQAVISHVTALVLHGLSDLLPAETHLTVPPKYRKPASKGVVLHRAKLGPAEVEEREGFQVTTPIRTLLDVSADTAISEEHLERAISEALGKGLFRRSTITELVRQHPTAERLSQALAGAS